MESPTSPESAGTLLVLQLKPFVGFKSQDEYLLAMKEDLAEWFTCLYQIEIGVDNFFDVLDTGVRLCKHANNVRNFAHERRKLGLLDEMHSNFVRGIQMPHYEVQYRDNVKPQTFQARDNISNFIKWTKDAGIPEVLSFETDDLVLRKNEKNVVLCLLEIARIGAKLGMLAPTIVQMEEEIDAEIAGDPPPQIITCDVKSLDEMVKWLAGRCTCPVQFPIIKVGEGKYKIGDSQTLVFVRILRKHVMIRVGGGWDTLEHYLDKHDPCRCGFAGHRTAQGTGQRQPTTPRRSSTPALSQTLPSSMKSPRKQSLVSNSYQGVQRPPSPVRMRSASPGPNPRKLPTQPNVNLSGSSSLSSNGNNNSNVNGSKNNTVLNQTPANNRLKSPSPVPSATKKTQGIPNNRPTSPLKRCSSPAPAKRCTSPSPARKSLSQTPSKHKILATSRSTPSTPSVQRRKLPHPKVDSCGNSEMSDSGSGNSVPSMEQISTMTLDEFKNLLNNALSVPNGNASEASLDSPRSQSSTDSFRNYSFNSVSKKPPVSDQKAKTWGHSKTSNVSKSFDSNYRGVKNHTILEKPELPEKPKKILTQSASWNRPKTPTSSIRPKTPVSSATNRPKTPVASVRSKTAVVSSARPKTPTSTTRSHTPVLSSNTYCSLDSASELSSNKSKSSSVDWSNRKLSYSNSDNDSTDLNERTRMNTYQTQQQNYVTNGEAAGRLSQVNTSRDTTSMGTFTGIMASKFQDDNQKSNGTLFQTSSFKSTTDYKSNKSDTNSQLYSNKTSSVSMKSDGSCFNSTEEQRPNIGYVTIKSDDDKYENTRKQGSNVLTSSNSIAEHVQSQLGLTDSSKKDSNKYNSSSAMESKFDLFKKTFQSSSETEQNTNTSELLRNNSYDRQNSREKEFSDLILPEEKPIESDNESKPSLQQLPPRPSTPSGRCTPSLIPRPATPVGNLKEIKEKAEKLINEDVFTVTKSIENLTSLLTEQTSPVSTEAPSRKITPPSQSSILSVKSVTSPQSSTTASSNSNNSGRPPTPRKSNILVKAQSPSSISKGSYTSQFMQRRAMTPGPGKTESKIVPVRRSTTPGPSDRENFLRRSENFEIDFNEPKTKTISTSQSQNLRPSANFTESRQSRTVPSSPVVQRRPRTPSTEPRALSRQPAVDNEAIVVTVDRSKGQHNIDVQRNGESSYKSPKPISSRIIARSPAAGRPKQNVSDNAEQNRLRSRSVDVTQQNNRSQSIDRTRKRNESNPGEVVLTVSKNQGPHVVNKRTEAWVEDAVKTVAKTRHGSKLNKSLSHGYQRSKTPNPTDMRNHQSRSLEEIKAALSLPINGMTISTETLEVPPEDPEMYNTMDKLFEQMRRKELRASVNETPGLPQNNVPNGNDDEYSLDSNENVKRKISVPSKPSSRQSTPSRESVSSTPSRSKTPSISRSSSSSQPVNRPASTPPRPCTPTRSKTPSRRSSSSMQSDDSSSGQFKRSSINHATVLVSKIKEMLNVQPRKDIVDGPKTRIPAPASLAKTGKSRSFSNLSATTDKDNPYSRQSFEINLTNGDYNCDTYDDYDDCGNEVGFYSRNNGSDTNSDQSDKYRSGSGSKTPVPKIATPLSTGRTSLLNNQRGSSSKLIRALSASSLSSTTSQTFSYSAADDDGYV